MADVEHKVGELTAMADVEHHPIDVVSTVPSSACGPHWDHNVALLHGPTDVAAEVEHQVAMSSPNRCSSLQFHHLHAALIGITTSPCSVVRPM
jgi:hypothetical protein